MTFPFHRIGVDPGVTLHDNLEDMVNPKEMGSVIGYSLVNGENMQKVAEKNLVRYFRRRRFSEGLEIKSVLATLSTPRFPKTWKTAKGLIVLNGAAGDRAKNLYLDKDNNTKKNIGKKDNSFAEEYKASMVDVSDIDIKPQDSNVFSVEAKNLFNFFHFLTETLHQLELVPDNASVINIISRNKNPKSFAKKWIEQLYPELIDKINFIHPQDFSKNDYTSTLTPMSGKHLLYQFYGKHIDMINERAPRDAWWRGYDARKFYLSTIDMNSYDSSLLKFQKRGIRLAAETGHVSNVPFVYVARKHGYGRVREMPGEDKLFSILKDMGFVKVYLEEMEPLSQVALMNSAKCVVMQHGAGMSNMIFGNPYTHFFEIGTVQTISRRWDDFIPLTHIGQCHYHSFCVDMDFPEEAGMPDFDTDGLVSPKLDNASIQKIVETIESCMNEDMPGSVAGLVHHAENIRNAQVKAMLGGKLKEQLAKLV